MESKFLPSTQIEIISKHFPRGDFRHVLFDFDGTISLIRQGWQQVMIPMMVDILAETPQAESKEKIERVVAEFVTRMTGKQTIYQIIALCEEIKKRGGTPREPLDYKHQYLDLLLERIRHRREGLGNGPIRPAEMLVPGAVQMLETLRERGLTLYCASGTDEPYTHQEAKLLGVSEYFNGGLFGARDDYESYSKRKLIERIIADHKLQGREFLAFGDGFVEIEETKAGGGVAVGLATDEEKREGVNAWKRDRLIEAGADIIVPDFRETEVLVGYLFENDSDSWRKRVKKPG